jgi:hypothetical protein
LEDLERTRVPHPARHRGPGAPHARLRAAVSRDGTHPAGVSRRQARSLERRGILGKNVLVVGTNAIFAYEAAAGVFVDTPMLATNDLDILFDARTRLRLRVEKETPVLLDALKDADPSFERIGPRGYSAVNADGYYVDLLKATPRNVLASREPDTLGSSADLHASHISNMQWVTNAPKFSAMAVGADGAPVPLACPDPRAFALYKLWMGTRDPARDPLKRARDVQQAKAVAGIVNEYMPNLPFEPEHLTCFPRRATDLALEAEFFKLR